MGAAAAGLPGGLGAGRARQLLRKAGGLHHRRPCHRQVLGGTPSLCQRRATSSQTSLGPMPPASLLDAYAAGILLQCVTVCSA